MPPPAIRGVAIGDLLAFLCWDNCWVSFAGIYPGKDPAKTRQKNL